MMSPPCSQTIERVTESPEPARPKQVTEPSLPDLGRHDMAMMPISPSPSPGSLSGRTIRGQVRRLTRRNLKRFECGRGQFVTFTPEELKALDVESSNVIDLEKFVPRGDLDPVYLDTP